MPAETMEMLLAFFKALADETRLRMLGLLSQRECSVEEIAVTLGVKEPTVSHHLGKLKELNLVTMRAEGNSRLYRMNGEGLRALSKDVLTPETLAQVAAKDLGADKYETKVMRVYVVDGRLTEIPGQRKKRDVILRWLVEKFDVGRRYTETEVNEVLRQFHEDVATLRREFIMTGLMERSDRKVGEQSLYWRVGSREQAER